MNSDLKHEFCSLVSKGAGREEFQALIERGLHPDAEILSGQSALCLGIVCKLPLKVLLLLLSRGADPNTRNRGGLTALHVCIKCRASLWHVLMLLNHRARPNAPDANGLTPVHYAAKYNAGAAVLACLLDNGGLVHAMCNKGTTPLQVALANNAAPELVQTLLERGANPAMLSSSTPRVAELLSTHRKTRKRHAAVLPRPLTTCAACRAHPASIACKHCGAATYCSPRCQSVDWLANHQHVCHIFSTLVRMLDE